MSLFRVGDRVQYIGHQSSPQWLKFGTVAKVHTGNGTCRYDVDYDDGTTPSSKGIRATSFKPAPPVDWTKPIELNDGTPLVLNTSPLLGASGTDGWISVEVEKGATTTHVLFSGINRGKARSFQDTTGKHVFEPQHYVRNRTMTTQFKHGDRVRYTGKSTELRELEYLGDTGTVDTSVSKVTRSNVPVRWDVGSKNHSSRSSAHGTRGVFPENIELITSGIDTTKPIELLTFGRDEKEVKILAVNPDGSILVDLYGTGKDSHWMLFDANGKFVRAPGGGGSACALRNKPEEVTHRFQISLADGQPFFTPVDIHGQVDLQVTVADGKVTKVTPRG